VVKISRARVRLRLFCLISKARKEAFGEASAHIWIEFTGDLVGAKRPRRYGAADL
jgi:hypothetical protein